MDITLRDMPWIGALLHEDGFYQRVSPLDDIDRLYAWCVLEDGKVAIIVGQSMETLLAPYNHLRRTYL